MCMRVQAEELEIKTRVNRKSMSDAAVAARAQLKTLQDRRRALQDLLQDVLQASTAASLKKEGEGGDEDEDKGEDAEAAGKGGKQMGILARIAKSSFVQVLMNAPSPCSPACTARGSPAPLAALLG